MDELKACPFCGKTEPLIVDTDTNIDELEEGEGTGFYTVCCNYLTGGCGATGAYRETEQEAIVAWNRRTQPENKSLSLEELRQMDGEFIWFDDYIKKWSGYMRVDLGSKYLQGTFGKIKIDDACGTMGLAYAHKPEKEPS